MITRSRIPAASSRSAGGARTGVAVVVGLTLALVASTALARRASLPKGAVDAVRTRAALYLGPGAKYRTDAKMSKFLQSGSLVNIRSGVRYGNAYYVRVTSADGRKKMPFVVAEFDDGAYQALPVAMPKGHRRNHFKQVDRLKGRPGQDGLPQIKASFTTAGPAMKEVAAIKAKNTGYQSTAQGELFAHKSTDQGRGKTIFVIGAPTDNNGAGATVYLSKEAPRFYRQPPRHGFLPPRPMPPVNYEPPTVLKAQFQEALSQSR
jgi:hypothetical protein